MKKIDFEAHYIIPEGLSALEKIGMWDPATEVLKMGKDCTLSLSKSPYVHKGIFDLTDFRIAEMDRFGVTTQILSASTFVEVLPAAESVEVARKCNDRVAEAIRRHPGRFLGFAALPVHDLKAAVDELSRCINELGFVGLLTHANYFDCYPDEERFAPIFDHLTKLGGFLYLHPNSGSIDRLSGYGWQLASAPLGFTIETLITTARMIFNGTFDRNPTLKMILGHYGEAFAVLIDRMDARGRMMPKASTIRSEHDPGYYFSHNIWVTTSGNFSPLAYDSAKSRFGIEHMMFGSDFPYETMEESMAFLDQRPMTVEERERLFHRNAEEFFGITC